MLAEIRVQSQKFFRNREIVKVMKFVRIDLNATLLNPVITLAGQGGNGQNSLNAQATINENIRLREEIVRKHILTSHMSKWLKCIFL